MIDASRQAGPLGPWAPWRLNRNAPIVTWGLTSWWIGVPTITGGQYLYDLVGDPVFNHGTLKRMASRATGGWAANTRPGAVGPALLYDGAVSPNGDYVKLASTPTTTGTLTVSGWFNMSATSAIIGLYLASSTSTGGHVIFGRSSTEGTFLASCSATPANNLKYNATATANTWYHVTITKSSSAITGFFVNGVTASAAATTFFTCNNVNALIGGDHLTTEGDFPWAGWTDSIKLWNGVSLTAAQIMYNYQEERTGHRRTFWRDAPIQGDVVTPPATSTMVYDQYYRMMRAA